MRAQQRGARARTRGDQALQRAAQRRVRESGLCVLERERIRTVELTEKREHVVERRVGTGIGAVGCRCSFRRELRLANGDANRIPEIPFFRDVRAVAGRGKFEARGELTRDVDLP